jgi:N-acetylglucosamine malate deacetylase 2
MPLKTLYIFPHPDDESFGPAPVIYRQTQRGEEVHLLTLTKGGATKQRFKYNLTIAGMGDLRVKEMETVQKVLGLTSMEILDLEDGGMAQLNPLELEAIVLERIEKIRPDIVVTYAIHGISCHHDHLAIHPVIKRLFCAKTPAQSYWKRLAFFTLPSPENSEKDGGMAHVRTSRPALIDCIVLLNEEEKAKLKEALFCYESFMDVIEQTQVIERIGDKVHFEFFGEDFKPVLRDLTEQLIPLAPLLAP